MSGEPWEQRFWAKVRRLPGDGCWEWTAGLRDGYGWFKADKSRLAHRVAWTMEFGDPGELFVCHRCDNRKCVRPSHLFLGTLDDNMQDAACKGRLAQKLTAAQVKAIKAQRNQGARTRDIAKQFGVDSCTVTDIAMGRTWRHVA